MSHRPLDPRHSNLALDANALDRGDAERNAQVERFNALIEAEKLRVVVGGGVRAEVQNPHTPEAVQAAILPRIFNLRPALNTTQQDQRRSILAVVQGNAKPGQHAADASHLAEAAETACAYFITHDRRFLKKRDELRPVLPPTLWIVTLAEFLTIYDDWEVKRPA